MNPGAIGDPGRQAACRALIMAPRPLPPSYAPHLTLDERRLRMLVEWESIEALKLAKAAGLEKQ
jgi:hypothetical protein